MITFIKTKSLLACGVIVCPLFILTVLIQGSIRSDYNPYKYPLSSLSIGDQGWVQIANFIITGLLIILFSVGLKRIFNSEKEKFHAPLLMMLVGIGLTGAGIFVTDPVFGYPENQPLILKQFTFHGHLHDAFSMLVFICLPWMCFAFRKQFSSTGKKGWAGYSAFTGFTMITAFILASMGFKQFPGFVDLAGASQRLCIVIGGTWITLLSLHLMRSRS
jgi:hypothetical protein